jgi:hypothetical protein
VDYEFCGQSASLRDFRLARWATLQHPALGQQFWSCRAMNSPVHTAAAEQQSVRRINNGIHLEFGDVRPS